MMVETADTNSDAPSWGNPIGAMLLRSFGIWFAHPVLSCDDEVEQRPNMAHRSAVFSLRRQIGFGE